MSINKLLEIHSRPVSKWPFIILYELIFLWLFTYKLRLFPRVPNCFGKSEKMMKTLSSAAVVIGALRVNEWLYPDKNQNVINELICTLTLPIYYSVCFFCRLRFFQNHYFFEKFFQETFRVSNCLDLDKA